MRVLAERWNESTPATQVGSAYFVFAAIEENGKPRPVPPVIPRPTRTGAASRRRRSGGPTGWPAVAPSGNSAPASSTG